MKKRCVPLAILCVFLFSYSAQAEQTDVYVQEQLQQSGAEELWSDLSPEAQELYGRMGVQSIEDLAEITLSADKLGETLWDIFRTQAKAPLAITGTMIGAVVLCAYLGGMRDTLGTDGVKPLYQTVCVLGICGVMVIPFTDSVQAIRQALSGVAVFMGSFSPVYIAVLAAGGQLRSAFSYQSVLLAFSQLLSFLTSGILMPIVFAAMGMGMVTAVSDRANLSKISEILLKAVSWTLGIAATLFTTLLSVNSMLGAADDSLGNRVVKLSIASLVPVVGSALSEAYLTIRSCVGLVRSTIGVFGMLTTGFLIIPTLLQSVCWQAGLAVCGGVADMLEQEGISRFLKLMSGIARTMTAALLICGAFMVVATALVIVAGRGTV